MLYDYSPYAFLTHITGIMLKWNRRCKWIFQNLGFILANSREMSQLFFPSEYFWISETWTANCATWWSQCAVNHHLVYGTKSIESWQNCRWSCDVPVPLRWIQIAFHGKILTFVPPNAERKTVFWCTHVCFCVFNAITKEQTIRLYKKNPPKIKISQWTAYLSADSNLGCSPWNSAYCSINMFFHH